MPKGPTGRVHGVPKVPTREAHGMPKGPTRGAHGVPKGPTRGQPHFPGKEIYPVKMDIFPESLLCPVTR